jgi:hypothetical protein
MAEEHHKVHAELEVHDHASHVLEHVKEGFEHVGEEAKEVSHEVAGFLKNAASMALGIELAGAVETMKSIGEEVFHAASGMEEQEKAIKGVMMMIDEEGTSLEEMGKQAHELNEEFAQMGVATGASKDELVGAFAEMTERTGLAVDEVKELTGEMAQAGRAVPGGIGALSAGFSNLSSGMIRARDPIISLIRATGVLKGSAHEIAQKLTKMGPEAAMKAGIAAVEKMGAKMKNVPLTFNETIKSMAALREQIFEAMGTPLLKALGGPLNQIRDYFIDNKEAVAKWAEEVGTDVGEWLKESFAYLEAHGEEIKEALHEGAHYVKEAAVALGEVVHFMWDHREAIALAYGATKVAGIAGGGAGGLAAAEGVVAVALVADQVEKLSKETGGFKSDAQMTREARIHAAEQAAHGGDVAETKRLGDAFAEVDPELRAMADNLLEVARQSESMNRATERLGTTLNGATGEDSLGIKSLQEDPLKQAEVMADYYAQASKMNDTATLNYLNKFSSANMQMFDALNAAGPDFDRAAWEFIEHVSAFAPAMAAAMAVKYGREHGTGTRAPEHVSAAPVQDFRGSTFHISQDFKNMDPDRMMIVFKKSLARSAQSKTTAATQTPHTAF